METLLEMFEKAPERIRKEKQGRVEPYSSYSSYTLLTLTWQKLANLHIYSKEVS